MNIVRQDIRVVTAADAGYVHYLACFLGSLATSQQQQIRVTVIHREISVEDRYLLGGLVGQSHQVDWVPVLPETLATFGAPLELGHLPPHYFRLLIPYLLRSDQRALYLDADTAVLSDLTELWNQDLLGYPVAATRDYLESARDAIANWEALGIDPDTPYLNSGVMLMDLTAWRAEEISEQVLAICRDNKEFLYVQGKWGQHDQYGINVALKGRWTPLDRRWNHGAFLPPDGERIVHFIGDAKIEGPACQDAFRALFLKTVEGTAFWPIRTQRDATK